MTKRKWIRNNIDWLTKIVRKGRPKT